MDNILTSSIGVMNIMDNTGHRQLFWNMSDAKEIAAAQKAFNRLLAHGHAAFGAKHRTAPKQAITTFDPTMEEMVIVPRIVGG